MVWVCCVAFLKLIDFSSSYLATGQLVPPPPEGGDPAAASSPVPPPPEGGDRVAATTSPPPPEGGAMARSADGEGQPVLPLPRGGDGATHSLATEQQPVLIGTSSASPAFPSPAPPTSTLPPATSMIPDNNGVNRKRPGGFLDQPRSRVSRGARVVSLEVVEG